MLLVIMQHSSCIIPGCGVWGVHFAWSGTFRGVQKSVHHNFHNQNQKQHDIIFQNVQQGTVRCTVTPYNIFRFLNRISTNFPLRRSFRLFVQFSASPEGKPPHGPWPFVQKIKTGRFGVSGPEALQDVTGISRKAFDPFPCRNKCRKNISKYAGAFLVRENIVRPANFSFRLRDFRCRLFACRFEVFIKVGRFIEVFDNLIRCCEFYYLTVVRAALPSTIVNSNFILVSGKLILAQKSAIKSGVFVCTCTRL